MIRKITYYFDPLSWNSITAYTVLCLLIIWFVVDSRRHPVRKGYSIFRFIVLLILLTLLINPERIKTLFQPQKPVIAILLDRSLSMKEPYSGKYNKMEFIQSFWEKEKETLLRNLPSDVKIRYYDFSTKLSNPLSGLRFSVLDDGTKTNLYHSVQEILARTDDKDIAAIWTLTDANENVESSFESLSADIPPVSILRVLSDTTGFDIGIGRIEHSGIMYKGEDNSITAHIFGENAKGKSVPVYLYEGDNIIKQDKVKFTNESEDKVLEFKLSPKELGKKAYRVEIGNVSGDKHPENNRSYFILETVRNKIRIMFVAGRPTWEYKFLRQTLKKDPSVELVAFTILRSPSDIRVEAQYELSLIPFPIHEIFGQHLDDFDLLIFNNFNYREFPDFLPIYLKNINDFVKKGGAFLVTGTLGVTAPTWAGTPLDELLPVQIPNLPIPRVLKPFRIKPVDINHPIMRISPDDKKNISIWNNLPELNAYQRLLKPKKDATVLLEHADLGYPIILAMNFGKGRVIFVNTDTTWHWKFFPVATTGLYDDFWRNAVRWLIRMSSFAPIVRIDNTDKFFSNEEISIPFQVLDKSHIPNNKSNIRVFITPTGKNKISVPIIPVSPNKGIYEIRYLPTNPDKYHITIIADKDKYEEDIVVESRNLETSPTPAGNIESLKKLVSSSGGKWIDIPSAENVSALPVRIKEDTIKNVQRVSLVYQPWVWALIILLLSIEWILRRTRGDL